VCDRYHITPARELQFGAMTLSSRRSRTFTIDNLTSKFEFRFNISATPTDQVVESVAAGGRLVFSGGGGTPCTARGAALLTDAAHHRS